MYTASALGKTFDLIKRLIILVQLGIQVIYVSYIVYKLVMGHENMVINIILLVISTAYLIFMIKTTKEFYTKKELRRNKWIKRVFKLAKYLVYVTMCVISIIGLLRGTVWNENGAMLVTIAMIFGITLSIFFDIVLLIIDKQIELIKASFRCDMEQLKASGLLPTKLAKIIGCENAFDDEDAIRRVENAHHEQVQKRIRKQHFDAKKNK